MNIIKYKASEFATQNLILQDGQFGLETDTRKLKLGNGNTSWNSLSYFTSGGSGDSTWGSITGTLSDQTDLNTVLSSKISSNPAIVASTNTKITYDTNGLITESSAATQDDIGNGTTYVRTHNDYTTSEKTSLSYITGVVVSQTIAGVANNVNIVSAGTNAIVNVQPTVVGASRFYITPKGTPSGVTGKFDIFNTDYVGDNLNYSGTTWFCNNSTNKIEFGPNRLGSVTRLAMTLGGDYIGSSITATCPRIDFNTNETLTLNKTGGNIGIGSVEPEHTISFLADADKTIGVDGSNSSSTGKNLTISAGYSLEFDKYATFTALSQTSRAWQGMSSNGTDIYAVVSNGDIYKQSNSTGNFIGLGETSRVWSDILCASNGNIYACVDGGDIYMQTGGTGSFVALSQTSRAWKSLTQFGTDIYASYNGGVAVQSGLSGNFNVLTTSIGGGRFASNSTGVYITVSAGDIYKRVGGTGSFIALNQTSRLWRGLCAVGENIYACVYNGGIYLQLNGTGDFVSLNQTSRLWNDLTSNGTKVYCTVDNSDIYQQLPFGLSDQNGGDLVLGSGINKGVGHSKLILKRSTRSLVSSSSLNELVDASIIFSEIVLTNNTVVNLFEVALPTLKLTGGIIDYTIVVTDGVDVQSVTNMVKYQYVNKGGVYTGTIEKVSTDSVATSSGTLSTTFSVIEGSNKITIAVNANSSLTPTYIKMYAKLHNGSTQSITIL
jgi:hypothetical protein